LFLFASTGICGSFIQKILFDYFSYQVVSNIQIKYEYRLEFPIIGICNQNLVQSANSNEYAVNRFRNMYPSMSYRPIIPVIMRDFFFNNTDLNIDDLILACWFNGKSCNITNDFEAYLDTAYGSCFRFNSGKNMLNEHVDTKYTYQQGLLNGLILEFYIQPADRNENVFSISNGLNIFINDQPSDSIYEEGINIAAGTNSKILINIQKMIKQPRPYSECVGVCTHRIFLKQPSHQVFHILIKNVNLLAYKNYFMKNANVNYN
jgi:hypothetical protein